MELKVEEEIFPTAGAFTISRGSRTQIRVVTVTLRDGKHVGRCVDVAAKGATPYCISDIQVGTDLSVTYRFHASLLGQWMDIDHAVRARIDGGRVETF